VTGVWASVWVTTAIQVLCALAIYAPPVLAPVAQAEVGLSASSVGVVMSLVFAAATCAALLSGTPIARYGALRVSQGSLLLCGAGLALMVSANAWVIALGAIVIGLGYGVVTPSSSSILTDRVPRGLRAFVFSLKQTGVPIGGALAGALLPAGMLAFGWRGAALAAAVACGLLALGIQPWRERWESPRHARQPGSRQSFIAPLALVFRSPRLRELALASFSYSGMQNCLAAYLVVDLHERIGFSVSAAGLSLSAAMGAGIAGRILWGVVADRVVAPRRLLGLLGFGMSLASLFTAAITPSWPTGAVLALSVAFGVTAVGWNGVYLAELAHAVARRDSAAATGAALALTYAGIVTLPLLFWGIVLASGSYAASYAAVGCVTLWRSARLFRSVRHAVVE